MTLHKKIHGDDFHELVAQATSGEAITLANQETTEKFIPVSWHIDGFIAIDKTEKQVLLNGDPEKILWQQATTDHSEKCIKIEGHKLGFIIQLDNKLYLNAIQLLYDGPMKWWQSHPDGVLIFCETLRLIVIKPEEEEDININLMRPAESVQDPRVFFNTQMENEKRKKLCEPISEDNIPF
ncbi:MAG: hypothetical protein WCP18_00715 [bacterium]